MGELSLIECVKDFIAGMGWRLFLWGSGFSEEEYFNRIYEQEKALREKE